MFTAVGVTRNCKGFISVMFTAVGVTRNCKGLISIMFTAVGVTINCKGLSSIMFTLPPGMKRPGFEINHSNTSVAAIKNVWRCIPISLYALFKVYF
jgi:hypothetical protein